MYTETNKALLKVYTEETETSTETPVNEAVQKVKSVVDAEAKDKTNIHILAIFDIVKQSYEGYPGPRIIKNIEGVAINEWETFHKVRDELQKAFSAEGWKTHVASYSSDTIGSGFDITLSK